MKKIFLLASLFLSLLLSACQTVPEEQISRLETYYLQAPEGGSVFFEKYADKQSCRAAAEAAIESSLGERGYKRAGSQSGAQFIVAPHYYPETFEYPDPLSRGQGALKFGTALNLSIRITTPSGQFLFSGDTRYKLTRENLNAISIARQVEWALKHFPQRAGAQN
ncbi:MAG: hypothetical protein IKO42_01410 [Opitutales bacterium]|nr:hypothetical protein [Opitutales bacterium]